MPSGPKKRKAAKKKKEKELDSHSDPSSPSAHSHEADDGKHRDEQESDVGELSFPASQDRHRHQILLTDGEGEEEEEIEKEENFSNVPVMGESKIDDSDEINIVIEDENAGEVKREFEIPSESEYNEPSKKSNDGGSSDGSAGGGCSSDDESNGIKNTTNVDISPVLDPMMAAAVPERSSETLHSDSSIEEAGDSSYPIKKSGDCGALESVLDENEAENISSHEHEVYSADMTSDRKAEEAMIRPIENTATISDPKAFETQESGHRLTQPYNPAVSEPLLDPASHPEKMSWKSCCGLFEAFAREMVMSKKGRRFGAVCHSGLFTPQNLQWVSTISTAALMLVSGTTIQRSFLAPLFALQAPASVVSWIKGEYGIWTAFLALLVRLFFFIPGELELPFITLLLVILAPNQVMSRLRGTQEGIILSLIIVAYLAFQHFSRTGSFARSFDQGSIFATLAIISIIGVSCLRLI